MSVIGLFMIVGVGIYTSCRLPVYEYIVNAHYIDGSTQTLIFESRLNPKIKACRGTYWLEYEGYNELGVVRFEIINKIEKKND